MNLIKKVFLIAISTIILISTALSDKTKLTTCYKYNFTKGDTLIYKSIAFDSVSVNYDLPIKKTRYETIEIACTEITKNNTFILTQRLMEFNALESNIDEELVEHSDSPWLGRTVWYEIDSLGNRLNWGVDDTTLSANAPGGSFQQCIFVPLSKSCKRKGSTWVLEALVNLPENGIPTPVIKETYFSRAHNPLDTLNEKCKRFEFIKTGQGKISLKTPKTNLTVSSVINSAGVMTISAVNSIPVHLYYSIEQKLQITKTDTSKQIGFHFITADLTLTKFIKSKKK